MEIKTMLLGKSGGCRAISSVACLYLVLFTSITSGDQSIDNGSCNVQIDGSNNTVVFSGCETSTEAQKLQLLLERVLSDIRVSLIREDEMVFPAMETFLNNPSEETWNKVVWNTNESLKQIQAGIDNSYQYDAAIANSSEKARMLVAEANRSANKQYFNQFRSVREVWNGRAFIKQQFQEGKRIPTTQQVREWLSDLKSIYAKLDHELTFVIAELAMANSDTEEPNKALQPTP
jgi:hypothetical protein